MSRKALSEAELQNMAENLSDIEPYEDSGSEYNLNSDSSSSDEESDVETLKKFKKNKAKGHVQTKNKHTISPKQSTSKQVTDSEFSESETEEHDSEQIDVETSELEENCWVEPARNFRPRMSLPENRPCLIFVNVDRKSSPQDVFLALFPRSLLNYISQCTNERLDILSEKCGQIQQHTDSHEIKIIIGCLFIMAYNKLPAISHYWSSNKSLGNEAIKLAISRDRFKHLLSKLYFSSPKKPDNASKTYYVDDLTDCLRGTFLKSRSDSSHQSIDESMTKFKGRSSLKQYLPLKPIKRGIKIWERCDSKTGYVYDFDIYCGRENKVVEGTLGERVVKRLTSTVKEEAVSFCFDRFFTSVNLLNTLPFPAVGTAIFSRKNMPKFPKKKRARGDIVSVTNREKTLACLWKDTKEVIVLSNCHNDTITEVNRTGKDGNKKNIPCPEAIKFYNEHMGGVDLSDQLTGLYEVDRKSLKWWKKVFYKLLLTSAVNAWIIYKEKRNRSNIPFLTFLVELAESLISSGRQHAKVVRKRSYGRSSISSRTLLNVGDHLPVTTKSRKRCRRCYEQKLEKRTTTICTACAIPLCQNCFTPYHT